MAERPILFSPPMVRAIRDGRKTVTRRVDSGRGPAEPFGAPGDRLWVREGYRSGTSPVLYRADFGDPPVLPPDTSTGGTKQRWVHGRYMPRLHARIFLEVVSIRREELHRLTDAEALLEGVVPLPGSTPSDAYAALWDELHGPGSWARNPTVRRIEFKVLQGLRTQR